MHKLLTILFALSMLLTGCGEKQEKKPEAPKDITNTVYELYQTSNMWNFIKLNTRNGKMTMVQYAVDDNSDRMEYELSDKALVSKTQECNGRFELHKTQNIYNFILLDRISGKTWQVQWSFNEDNQAVIPITEM